MLIFIFIDVQYLQNVAFSFKKVQMVKITLPRVPTTQGKIFFSKMFYPPTSYRYLKKPAYTAYIK